MIRPGIRQNTGYHQLQNGVYHLADGTFRENKMFCRNRLPVAYNVQAAAPRRWLTFLGELLEAEDIPTLQEYLGYCLIPSTKGQRMMLINCTQIFESAHNT